MKDIKELQQEFEKFAKEDKEFCDKFNSRSDNFWCIEDRIHLLEMRMNNALWFINQILYKDE